MAFEGMDKFCGSKFWDLQETWYTEDPDLTPCFQKTVLVWVPCAFLWIFSSLETYYILHSKSRNIPWNWLNISKLIITILLIVLSAADLGQAIQQSSSGEMERYSVDYYVPVIKMVTFGLAAVLLWYNRKRGLRTSGLLFLFWLLLVLFGVVQYRAELVRAQKGIDDKMLYPFVSYMIYYPLVVIMFLLNCKADAAPRYTEHPPVENPCPEQGASFLSRILFAWFDSLAWKGFRMPLETKHLWSMNPEDTAQEVVPVFDKYWQRTLLKNSNVPTTKASFRKTSGSVDFVGGKQRKKSQASILPAICKAFGPTFIFGSLLKLIQDVLIFVNPQILKLLIQFTGSNESLWKGYLYAVLMLVTASVQTIFLAQYFNRMFIVGLRIRTALISAIYRKALRMSNAARKESTVGEIVNLMSVDAQRFMDLTAYLNMIWSAPLQISLALYFLWDTLGPSVMAGLAVMIILIPVNGVVANRVKTLQIRQMKNKDERVKLMNEVLSGIKVLKLYAWEPSFEQQILKIRDKEINVLKQAAYLNAATSFIWSCAPFLVSLATFGTYVLVDENNVLDAEKAFVCLTLFNIIRMPLSMLPMLIIYIIQVSVVSFATFVLSDENNVLDSETAFVSLSLFNILRFPLSMLPMLISNMVQASVSIKRMNKYMNSEELDPSNVTHDNSEKNPLVMENGTFSWGPDESPVLKNINLQIKSGSLVAVVGTVGSGKSSLISAFLGEMDKLTGRVNTKGSIAYVPQQAWIQNATLKDNIVFGKSLEQSTYLRVVEACALKPDFDMLPAGDQTEIGEKGINLSGGQKQRVSLARAVYNNADVFFLDDPLSAVDSHVGKHIFENVIGPTGLLKKKTRVLVTHGVTYLPEVDLIVVLKDGEVTEMGTYRELLEKKGAFAEFLVQHLQEVAGDDDAMEADLGELKQQLESTIGVEELQQKLVRARSRVSESHSDSASVGEKRSLSHSGSLNRQTSVENRSEKGSLQRLNSEKENNIIKAPLVGEKLIEVEKAETGSVKWDVYKHYLMSIGMFLSITTILLNIIFQAFSIGSNMWLSEWSNEKVPENGTVDTAKRDMYLGVYGGLGVGQVITVFISSLTLYVGGLNAARIIHGLLVSNVLRLPLSFFDVTPVGRILNRFSKDVDVLDNILPMNLRGWLGTLTSHSQEVKNLFCVLYLCNAITAIWFSLTPHPMFTEHQLVFTCIHAGTWAISSFFCDLAPQLGCWRAAVVLHLFLLRGILRAPLTFFDTTPIGRILGRFAKDVDVLDTSLPQQISDTLYCLFEVVATIFVISYSTPIFLSVIVPIGFLYYFVQRFYVATSRQLKRLESVSRSPIYSHFGESITGAPIIRAYSVEQRFVRESENKVDFNQVCYYPSIIANRWLAVRLEMVGNMLIFFSSLFAVLGRDSINPGLVGLSVSYALQITQTLNWLVRMTSDVETNIVAVERIKEYGETVQEAPWENPSNPVPPTWPSEGKVEFKDFQVRYREGLDLVLKGVTFTVEGGEKVGIVGRTGAGKSSLTLALFRIIEAAGGSICIDGLDISKLGLHDLRSRLTIIPQDPVLFSGTLRLNLDPFNTHSDEEVWRALEHAHLKAFVKGLPAGLNHEVTEGGENLSVGQRQLICLARALLRKTKVLVLDEATAAVDLETDDLIQRTIRTEFKDCTVLTIAHRLNTILDSNRVIVLDKGCVVEYDKPDVLLQKKDSVFYGMAKDAGIV